ncbi:hypothetical protein Ancab_022218 [Ancistrocladus abbreviatus]
MCGRGRCTLRPEDVPRACHLNDVPVRQVDINRYRPSYNVGPGSYLPVVLREDGTDGYEAAVHCMKWGLVPSFTKKDEKPDHFKMFNARSESISEKASFRRLVPKNRCVLAFEGFYEWKKDGSKKQPYYIHFKDGRALVFAALYDSWKNSEGEILYTFTILTSSSSSALQWLHDRMPVILGDEGSTHAWLNSPTSFKFETLLKPYEGSDLAWYPVTPAIGKLSFDGPECFKEIQLKSKGTPISKFFSKNGTDKVKGPKKLVKSLDDNDSALQNVQNDVGDELETKAKEEVTYDSGEMNAKAEVCAGSSQAAGVKCQTKRDYDEFLTAADTKPSGEEIEKPLTSPAKKKGNIKGASEKQPTMLSYFARS